MSVQRCSIYAIGPLYCICCYTGYSRSCWDYDTVSSGDVSEKASFWELEAFL